MRREYEEIAIVRHKVHVLFRLRVRANALEISFNGGRFMEAFPILQVEVCTVMVCNSDLKSSGFR